MIRVRKISQHEVEDHLLIDGFAFSNYFVQICFGGFVVTNNTLSK